MESDFSDKLDIWKNHVADAEADPSGVGHYCRENEIKSSVYYAWRQVIKNDFADESVVLPRSAKRSKASFIPVVVEETLPATDSTNNCPTFPDARWVAEVMLHLVRGLT